MCTGGDIIVAVDEVFINNMDELVYYLLINTIPGDVVTLLVVRDGDTMDIPVTLGKRPTRGAIIPECGED
jgi:S1-C subfamily serine protease